MRRTLSMGRAGLAGGARFGGGWRRLRVAGGLGLGSLERNAPGLVLAGRCFEAGAFGFALAGWRSGRSLRFAIRDSRFAVRGAGLVWTGAAGGCWAVRDALG
ncbi:MAG: hypothetical protein ACK4IT_10100 [Thioalkalivibrionaceae bacterium]